MYMIERPFIILTLYSPYIYIIFFLDACEDGYVNLGSHCYRLETENPLTYSAAVTACLNENATLGTPMTGNRAYNYYIS